MTLAFSTLGFAPLTGKAGIDQAVAFKRQLRSVLGSVDGAYALISPSEGQRCEVRVAYDRAFPGAENWAKEAEGLAAGLWDSLSERRRERV